MLVSYAHKCHAWLDNVLSNTASTLSWAHVRTEPCVCLHYIHVGNQVDEAEVKASAEARLPSEPDRGDPSACRVGKPNLRKLLYWRAGFTRLQLVSVNVTFAFANLQVVCCAFNSEPFDFMKHKRMNTATSFLF